MISTDPQGDLSPGSLLMTSLSLDGVEEPPFWRIVSDADLLERLYRLCGDFCHEARNRLNSLHLCLYLSRPEEDPAESALWDRLEASYREAVRQIELIQTICRPMRLELMPLSLELLIDDRAETWSRQWRSRGGRLDFRPPTDLARGLIDPMLLSRALDGLVAWRAAAAPPETFATIQWWGGEGEFGLDWIESSASTPDHPSSSSERPKARTRRETSSPPPAQPTRVNGAFTLALLARVIHEHGGTIEQADEPSFRVNLRWPSRVLEAEADERFSCLTNPGRS